MNIHFFFFFFSFQLLLWLLSKAIACEKSEIHCKSQKVWKQEEEEEGNRVNVNFLLAPIKLFLISARIFWFLLCVLVTGNYSYEFEFQFRFCDVRCIHRMNKWKGKRHENQFRISCIRKSNDFEYSSKHKFLILFRQPKVHHWALKQNDIW